MKKNDLMGYLVYAMMIGIAVGVGLGVIRPIFSNSNYTSVLQGNVGMVFVLLIVIGAIILTALMLEIGHAVGAKVGKYKITSWNCLFFQFKKDEKGKTKFSFANYDGITGETKYIPLNTGKSNPRHIIYIPLVFFLLEVVVCSVLIALAAVFSQNDPAWIWAQIVGIVTLTVGCMIFLYDIFPANLDGKNDGCLIPVLNNAINVRAYNEMLLAEDSMSKGLKATSTPVYQEVTDFTSRLNDVTIYNRLAEGDYKGALEINELAIASKDKLSRRVYNNAVAQKIAIHLYTEDINKAKEEYISIPLEEKKYIESLSSAPAVRAYILVSGLINDSINETKTAMDHADSAIKASGEDKRKVEERLMRFAVKKVISVHPDWDFDEYKDAFIVDNKNAVSETKENEAENNNEEGSRK